MIDGMLGGVAVGQSSQFTDGGQVVVTLGVVIF